LNDLQFPNFEFTETPGGVGHGLDEEILVAVGGLEFLGEFLNVLLVFGRFFDFDEDWLR